MQEILYIEVPTPDIDAVRTWLQETWQPQIHTKIATPDGIRLQFSPSSEAELSIFVWTLQRTTYLKMFLWDASVSDSVTRSKYNIPQIKRQLVRDIRLAFPPQYPEPPEIDLSHQSIFEALAESYPQTVKYFQKFPNGEYDLNRVYWWEKRWRESVRNPQQPKQVIFRDTNTDITPDNI